MKKWNIGWGTVAECNMRCEFCYSKFRRTKDVALGFEDWKAFLDSNYMYINTINYGTGENSLRDEWFKFIDYVRKSYPDIRQALTTNGYVTEVIKKDENKRSIFLNSIDEVDVSLDFADPEKHNCFRGQKKAYNWAIDTLGFCKENSIPITIVVLGSKKNAVTSNFEGIFEIANKYDALVRMNLYRPTEGVDEKAKEFILNPKELYELLYWINDKHQILSISDALLSNLLTDTMELDPSGIDSLRILPNGDISPSTYLIKENFIVGNIKDKEVLKTITESNTIQKLIYDVIPQECNECIYKNNCKGGVYDRRYLWFGKLEHKDPYCLLNTEEKVEIKKIHVVNTEFHSVHHGYLPTMFFKA